MGTAIKHPVPDRVKPSFAIFDIRALWRSALTHSCTVTHMEKAGIKGLTCNRQRAPLLVMMQQSLARSGGLSFRSIGPIHLLCWCDEDIFHVIHFTSHWWHKSKSQSLFVRPVPNVLFFNFFFIFFIFLWRCISGKILSCSCLWTTLNNVEFCWVISLYTFVLVRGFNK